MCKLCKQPCSIRCVAPTHVGETPEQAEDQVVASHLTCFAAGGLLNIFAFMFAQPETRSKKEAVLRQGVIPFIRSPQGTFGGCCHMEAFPGSSPALSWCNSNCLPQNQPEFRWSICQCSLARAGSLYPVDPDPLAVDTRLCTLKLLSGFLWSSSLALCRLWLTLTSLASPELCLFTAMY